MNSERPFDWLQRLDLTPEEIGRLLPAVPGSMTGPDFYYVNSAAPDVVFVGRTQGTIPMTDGLWYMFPSEIVTAHPGIRMGARPLAAARSLFGSDGPRAIEEWTRGG